MQETKGSTGSTAADRLSGRLLAELAQHGNTRPFRAQAILINEGDVGDSIYIVVSGRLWDPLESTCRHASLSIL